MKEAIKEFILARAKEVFEDKGYKNTSMLDVATAAKISKPTLYKYFPGKKDLFFTVIHNMQREIDKEILPIIDQDLDIVIKIQTLITKSLDFAVKNQKIFRMVLFESKIVAFSSDEKESSNDLQDILGKTHRDLFERKDQRRRGMELLIKQGQSKGIIRGDLEVSLIATLITGIIKELTFDVVFNHRQIPDVEKISKIIFKMISGGIMSISGGN